MSLMEAAVPRSRYVPKPETFWTEAKVEQLRLLVAEGIKGDALREALGCPTPDMLYSKLQRLKISMPKKPATPRVYQKRHRQPFAFGATPSEPVAAGIMDLPAEPSDAAVTLLALDVDRCHWPISGAGLDTMFCGERAGECGPYCTRHRRMAYRGRRNA